MKSLGKTSSDLRYPTTCNSLGLAVTVWFLTFAIVVLIVCILLPL